MSCYLCQELPKDLKGKRLEAVELLAVGLSQSEVARRLGVSRQAVNLWTKEPDFQEQVESRKKELVEVRLEKGEAERISNVVVFPRAHTHHTSNLDEARQRELEFLKEIENHMLPLLAEGSVRVASVLLKLSETRSKLLGLHQKSLPILEAVSMLLAEGILSEKHATIVQEGISNLVEKLQEVEDVVRESQAGSD